MTAPIAAVPTKARIQTGQVLAIVGDPRPGVLDFPPTMVAFTGGQFQIGNTQAEYQAIIVAEKQHQLEKEARNWYKDTRNQQLVTVAPFELARFPITNAQWAIFMAADGYDSTKPWWDGAARIWLARDDMTTEGLKTWQQREYKGQPEFWTTPEYGRTRTNHPVVGISWYEAMAFCRWLTDYLHDGFTYSLPSELEWEYAARGVEHRTYAWGNQEPDGEHANFNRLYDGISAVGCFPNGATPTTGLLDMTGNVWEWTRSAYRPYPYAPDDGREDRSEPVEKRFTLRGGGWVNPPIYLRASYRDDNTPVFRTFNVGLRLARHSKSVKRSLSILCAVVP